MKLLKDILYKVGIEDINGSTNIAIQAIQFDSRKVEKFALFIAVSGTQVDGHLFIDRAIELGAHAIICERLPEIQKEGITYIVVRDSNLALGIAASNFYDNPSSKLKLVGVTGTNGKTTTVTLLHKLFKAFGYKVGLLSTVVNKIDTQEVQATHTTPDALELNRILHEMTVKECSYCFMEVSSHAIIQQRIAGLTFTGGVFSNISHDHLDYHKTFSEYIKAKKLFFDNLSFDAFALVNKDDTNGLVMTQNTKASVKTFALKSQADFKCKIIENQFSGLLLNIDGTEVWTKLIGSFNAYNLVSVYAVAVLLGNDKLDTLAALSNLPSVEGRFQYICSSNKITAIVDYAHTPDALDNVLKTIKDIRMGGEQVITVIGCGGNRDATKRPIMAKIACQHSDKVILTSDNPRNEDPETIITQMKTGIEPQFYTKSLTITNRREAIRTACSMANEGDIILVAGKGHEKYQEIQGIKHPFDDMAILKEMFRPVKS